MKIVRAVSCWGNEASPAEALALAREWEFEAVEGPAPDDPDFRQRLIDSGKCFIAEISTGCHAGEYVPPLDATPADHLEDFRRKLDAALALGPLRISTLAGADFWDFDATVEFFRELLDITRSAGTSVCVETHRARPTFHPLRTIRLLDALPELVLTLDVSHWCVVCERQVPAISEWMDRVEPRVKHVHARVGYDQGPQVPDLGVPGHEEDFASHLACWKRIAARHRTAGAEIFTVTPEFGPDGYQHAGAPAGSLRDLNRRMGDLLKTV